MAVVSEVAGQLLERGRPFGINYHNITPPWFFSAWDRALSAATGAGRRQLADLAPACALAIGDSSFNTGDLVAAGASQAEVVPVLFDVERLGDPDTEALGQLVETKGPSRADWLFVGRVVPNKAQHDVILAFARFKREVGPDARLFLVGTSASIRYRSALIRLASSLDISDSVHFVGEAEPELLAAHYAAADVFVCLSEHEGFCVPIIEAMHHGVPVVAYRSSAVVETVDNGGVLIAGKDPCTVTTAVTQALARRDRLARVGRERARAFALSTTKLRMWRVLEGWLNRQS
jgi:glycosyltransferase involved in cell wall biosynthesis